jgi:hypothetical protein
MISGRNQLESRLELALVRSENKANNRIVRASQMANAMTKKNNEQEEFYHHILRHGLEDLAPTKVGRTRVFEDQRLMEADGTKSTGVPRRGIT